MSDGEKDESTQPEEAGSDDTDQDEKPGADAAEESPDEQPPPESDAAPAEEKPAEVEPVESKAPDSEDTVVPPGNRLHPVRGTLIAVAGAAIPFLLMTTDRHFGFSVPVGLLGCVVATFGIFDLLGTFDDPAERVAERISTNAVGGRLVELAAAGSALFLFLRLAVAGTLPYPRLVPALLITAAFLWCVVSVYRVGEALGPWKTDETGKARSLLYRHGFWLVVIATLIYLPLLGSYSLSDPWETHYGEVSREMLARDRLDFPVVGPRWLVLVQAGVRLLDPGPVLLGVGRRLHAGQDAHWRSPRPLPGAGVGRPHAGVSAHVDWRIPAVQGRRQGVRSPRRSARRAGAGHHAVLVLDRSPDDDRHALRRTTDSGDGRSCCWACSRIPTSA